MFVLDYHVYYRWRFPGTTALFLVPPWENPYSLLSQCQSHWLTWILSLLRSTASPWYMPRNIQYMCCISWLSHSKVIVCILNPAGMRKKGAGTLLLHWETEMYSHAIVVVWKWCFINAVVSKPVLRCRTESVNPFYCLLLCCLRYLVYCNLSKQAMPVWSFSPPFWVGSSFWQFSHEY